METLPIVIDCEGCGACCLHMGYPAFVRASENQSDEENWLRMPAELKQALLATIAEYDCPPAGELDGPCCWFDPQTRRCKHYDHRPQVCRDFAVGGPDCIGWRETLKEP